MEALENFEALVCLLGLRGRVASAQLGLGELGLVLPSLPRQPVRRRRLRGHHSQHGVRSARAPPRAHPLTHTGPCCQVWGPGRRGWHPFVKHTDFSWVELPPGL